VKVKPFVSVPLCASGFVTTTLTVLRRAPAFVASIMVLLTKLTFVAADPPMLTVAPETNALR